jgi:hypothetical protein
MGAAIVPRKKFAIDLEDADFRLRAVDDLAITVGVISHFSSRIFRHALLPVQNRPMQMAGCCPLP